MLQRSKGDSTKEVIYDYLFTGISIIIFGFVLVISAIPLLCIYIINNKEKIMGLFPDKRYTKTGYNHKLNRWSGK